MLDDNYFSFYSDKKIQSDNKVMFDTFYELVNTFFIILNKYKKEELKVKNIVFTKCYENAKKIIQDYNLKLGKETLKEDNITMTIKYDKYSSDNLLVHLYYNDITFLNKFLENIKENLKVFYTISF